MKNIENAYIEPAQSSPETEMHVAYEQLVNTISRTMDFAKVGNVAQTRASVSDIEMSARVLRLKGLAARAGTDLKTVLESFPEKSCLPSATVVLQYVTEPDAFVAEANLIAAEKALKQGNLAGARAAYAAIAPWQNLRKYLDDPVEDGSDLLGSLAERAQELDMNPLLNGEESGDN